MRDALVQDLRYAYRHIQRSPGFAAAAILTLAFGIGANTAVFTVLNALVIQRLPIKDPDGLISVSGRNARGQVRITPVPAVRELERQGPLQDVCGYNGGFIISVEAHGASTQTLGTIVTGRCFTTFGVAPILGRPIVDADAPLDSPGSRVVVIGHRFWTRMFGADPHAIGKTIRAEGVELTVIGVLPPGFGGLHVDSGADLFVPPDTIFPATQGRRPGSTEILGRLRPGVSLEQAKAQLETQWPAVLDVAVPHTLPPAERADLLAVHLTVQRMGTGLSTLRERYAGPLSMVLGLTALLLVLACVNLGALLLARLAARRTELAVRLALGGSRWRIGQQMTLESLLLSLSGAALAVPASFGIIAPLASFIPTGYVERSMAFTPDLRVLAATAAAGLSVGVLMSALPIWMAMRRGSSARVISDRTIAGATSRWARVLLVAQIAVSVVILIGTGLLVRSLYLLQRVNLGMRTTDVLTVKVLPLPSGYRGIEPGAYYPALLQKITSLPGVRSAGFSRLFPRPGTGSPGEPIVFVGDAAGDARGRLETVSPGFFETIGIPLIGGRAPSWSDTDKTRQVATVSQSLARALAPNGDVLGRRVRIGSLRGHQDVVIVGVVGNATLGNPRDTTPPVIYRPALQSGVPGLAPNLVVAVDRGGSGIGANIRQILKDSGREFAQEIITLDDLMARAPSSERMSATLAAAVGALAVLLALLGVHGALAYGVSRRTREIGVRVALGAAPAEVARMVLREGVLVTLTGVAIGLPLAFLTARAMRTMMFGVSEADPMTFAAAAAFFAALGLAAGLVPARRAARVNPAVALRAD